MSYPEQVLLVVDDPKSVRSLLEKALRLCPADGASALLVVQVVYEGLADLRPQDVALKTRLKSLVLEAAQEELENRIAAADIVQPDIQCAAIWGRRPWEAILSFAEMEQVDLVVKAASEVSSEQGLLRTPDDWNLLRHAAVPVLLMGDHRWPREPAIVAAVDVFDESHGPLNERIVRTASRVAERLGGHLHLAAAYPGAQPWMSDTGLLADYTTLLQEIVDDVNQRASALLARVGLAGVPVHALEGDAVRRISELARSLDAAFVVAGTHARVGVRAAILGNTSERLVHHLHGEVLTVG